jgi:hypothetical protein
MQKKSTGPVTRIRVNRADKPEFKASELNDCIFSTAGDEGLDHQPSPYFCMKGGFTTPFGNPRYTGGFLVLYPNFINMAPHTQYPCDT